MKIAFSPALVKKAERYVIGLIGLTVAVTLVVTLMAGRESLGTSISSISPSAIAWLLGLTLFESTVRFYRYDIAARALGLNVPFWRLMYYYTVGYGLLPTPGKVGVAIRLWLLKQYHGLPYSRTTPLLIMDFITDALAMASLAAFSLLLIDDPRLNTIGWVLGIGLALGLSGVLLAPRYMEGFVKMGYAMSGHRKPRTFARLLTLVRTTSQVLGIKLLFSTWALSFVGWATIGIGIAFLMQGFGHTHFGATEGSLIISLATMGGFITMMPAGVGGAEVTMAGLFTMFGVPFAQAVLATALVRLIVLWSTVLIGLGLLPIALRGIPKTKKTTK
ncbi:MAG: flippase-like domain-containing protein [Blastochloris viridis]|uniref:Flippase-like domain-containing protein n=1 Tax=Blastochloris viridis TaxID=1079 RepID=A0A6N4R5Q0_BLAVI|nr:MAG: flippase-like domain-containing protein [Blastochloris viridis]